MLPDNGRPERDNNNIEVTSRPEPQSENGGNMTARGILCNLDFWLWAITVTMVFSVNLTIFTNVGTYLRSLRIEDKTTLVSGLGVGTGVMFISATCILSDMLIEKVERITFLNGHIVLQTSLLVWVIEYINIFPLFLILILTVFTMQSLIYTMAPVITLEYFGDTHFGRLWGSILLLAGVGGLLVQVWFAHLYEMQVPVDGKSKTCFGADCFNLSSKMLCILSSIALITSGFLWFRQKKKRQYESLSGTNNSDTMDTS